MYLYQVRPYLDNQNGEEAEGMPESTLQVALLGQRTQDKKGGNEMMANYIVYYKNQGKSEKTPLMTKEKAEKTAEFLKFQGATNVRIVEKF